MMVAAEDLYRPSYRTLGITHQFIPNVHEGDSLRLIQRTMTVAQYCTDSVLCIDNANSGLSVKETQLLWEKLSEISLKTNVQIFAVTKSQEYLQTLFNSLDASINFRFIRLDRMQNGAINPVTYDRETLEAAFNLNLSIV
jgi:hypothetical protein